MTAVGSSGWRGRSLLDVTHRGGYMSRGRIRSARSIGMATRTTVGAR